VAWFGSQGVYAYDVNGRFLWKVDLGRLDLGAYDIPTYEWGPASSPIIWNGLVILQCDTQEDSFILALDANTGNTVWKTERDELPSWGTPTVAISDRPGTGRQRIELHPGLRPSHREGVVAARA
jgi:outer membrane protein assembly factor BamB